MAMSQDPGTPGTVPWIAGEADVYSQKNMAIILYIGFDLSPNQYVDVPYSNQTSLPNCPILGSVLDHVTCRIWWMMGRILNPSSHEILPAKQMSSLLRFLKVGFPHGGTSNNMSAIIGTSELKSGCSITMYHLHWWKMLYFRSKPGSRNFYVWNISAWWNIPI